MKIQVVGVNHRDSPLNVREKVAFGQESFKDAYETRGHIPHQEGMVILSTCNRTEIYVAGDVLLSDILSWWEELVAVPRGKFSDALFWYQDRDAAVHLMQVASGIDSMVLGETQILGQVKAAYQTAQHYQSAGRLHRLFQYAFRAGKRAHSETEIGRNALSPGYAVVELSRKVFGSLNHSSALVIGAGETGTLVARHLTAQGIGDLMIANRTPHRAEALANETQARVVKLQDLAGAIRAADIIVSCTSASAPIITYSLAAKALRGQEHKFRFFFDMAVPRDIDERVQTLGHTIFLYDIDDVNSVVDANLDKRRREVSKVERVIHEEADKFHEEMGATQVGSVIRSLREKAEGIRQEELTRALNRLPNLSEAERDVVADTTRIILNKFLNDAMVSMRSWGADQEKSSYVDAIRELFRLADAQDGVNSTDEVAVTGQSG